MDCVSLIKRGFELNGVKVNMPDSDLIEWNDSISLNIEEIDKQHKTLIEIINDLARLTKRNPVELEKVKILQKLIKYTNTHFTYEEIFFEDSDYTHRKIHVAEHKHFINRISNYYQERQNLSSEAEALLHFLKDWLLNHIQKTDREYVPYFRAK